MTLPTLFFTFLHITLVALEKQKKYHIRKRHIRKKIDFTKLVFHLCKYTLLYF
jgi:hypothetical protein